MFEKLGRAASLSVLSVYGGAPYEPQEAALKRGVDVVVGTPGRIKDLMERGTLQLTAIRWGEPLSRRASWPFCSSSASVMHRSRGATTT